MKVVSTRRTDILSKIEDARGSRLLVYVTGDRRGLETVIHPETMDFFTHHLDAIGDIKKISLFLYTRGGDTLGAWSIANLIRQFCECLEIIVPSKALSAGTLMCLAADTIVMTKQATLGPIDPSVNFPLNPGVPGAPPHVKVPVSVEDIGGYVEFAKSISDAPENMRQALNLLSANVHPLVLGNAFRARAQIRMLARKLMGDRYEEPEQILKFLCSESGSHDYTINRREAREELRLPVEKPDPTFYSLIKSLYDDIALELDLAIPFDPNNILGKDAVKDYAIARAIIQSLPGGTHRCLSEGTLTRVQVKTPAGLQLGAQDQRNFDGWRFFDGQE